MMHDTTSNFRLKMINRTESRVIGVKTAIEDGVLRKSRFNRVNLVIGPVVVEMELMEV